MPRPPLPLAARKAIVQYYLHGYGRNEIFAELEATPVARAQTGTVSNVIREFKREAEAFWESVKYRRNTA